MRDRLAVFIDGANLYASAKALGFQIDYSRLLEYFRTQGALVRALYYTGVQTDADNYTPLQRLIDYLAYNGYSVVTKPAKEFTAPDGQVRTKGNMDVDLAVDMMEMASGLDHIILMSGDGDFRPLVASVQRKGVRVTVISSRDVLADELRRQADAYVGIEDLRAVIGRG
ncbi:NYN domain-containing protein [Roseicella sp. DB1501]|uniref:LabA-like NYN domain-containing protein n=1 Tax=Roseicella sp. DB1501 TaxID=2730925 RepID=UPI001491241A|nr:NYN domain-containing protein [Roseicella sp. DB1501]NOG70459.1 NYN domain-containing protein [Roseicella sp. DB1501]